MIVAIGVDIIELERIRNILIGPDRARFLERTFTSTELEYCLAKADPVPHLAARFAAKEALQKCWPVSFSWQDVWVELDGRKPHARFAPALASYLQQQNWQAHLSLSHTHVNAVAMAVIETK